MTDMHKFSKVADNLDYGKRKQNREQDRMEAMNQIQLEEEDARRRKDESALKRLEKKRQAEELKRQEEEAEALRQEEEAEALRIAEEEARKLAEEEAKAQMEPILRFDSINDEEKDIMRQKERELQKMLED